LGRSRAAGRPPLPIQQCSLSEIPRHVLCVECLRCFRTVEIPKADAVHPLHAQSEQVMIINQMIEG
jgi:hypothetical protein